MKPKSHPFSALLLGLSSLALLVYTGCEISSGDDVTRNVTLNIQGVYANASGIPRRQSGVRITSLALSQSGDQLNVVDNEGTRWTGTIGRVSGNNASFTLKGLTTAGNEVVITGNIAIEGTTGRMTGTWVEPGFSSPISAEAGVAAQPTPTPTPENGNNGPTPVPTPTPDPNLVITFPPTP